MPTKTAPHSYFYQRDSDGRRCSKPGRAAATPTPMPVDAVRLTAAGGGVWAEWGVGERTFFRVPRLFFGSTDACAQAAFWQHTLEPSHQLLACLVEVLEDGPEEAEDFVVAWLAAPSEDLMDCVDLLSGEATRFARCLVQNQPHRV